MNQEIPSGKSNFTLLKDCNSTIDSNFLCGLLKSYGIEFQVITKGITPIMGDLEQPIPSIKIFVREGDLQDANKLLVKADQDHYDIEFQAYKHELKRRGRIWGRILSIISSIFFGSFLLFPINESDKLFVRYFFASVSLLFLLLFALQFDWKKED